MDPVSESRALSMSMIRFLSRTWEIVNRGMHAVDNITGSIDYPLVSGVIARKRALEFSPERQADAYLRVYGYLERRAGGASALQPLRARAT